MQTWNGQNIYRGTCNTDARLNPRRFEPSACPTAYLLRVGFYLHKIEAREFDAVVIRKAHRGSVAPRGTGQGRRDVKATIDVSLDTVASLLCSALEGGSNYWYEITSQHEPSENGT